MNNGPVITEITDDKYDGPVVTDITDGENVELKQIKPIYKKQKKEPEYKNHYKGKVQEATIIATYAIPQDYNTQMNILRRIPLPAEDLMKYKKNLDNHYI